MHLAEKVKGDLDNDALQKRLKLDTQYEEHFGEEPDLSMTFELKYATVVAEMF